MCIYVLEIHAETFTDETIQSKVCFKITRVVGSVYG